MGRERLTIIVPVYNEERTVGEALRRIGGAGLGSHEVIVVDDGSGDATAEVLRRFKKVRLIRHPENRGKGAAIRTALAQARGEWVVIQDADLEYDPKEIKKLWAAAKKTGAGAVYGTRNKGIVNRYLYPVFYWGAKMWGWVFNLIYGQSLTDVWTCQKLIRRDLINFEITERGFGVDVELTAKLAKRGIKVIEVPIKYKPRGYEQGKKIRWMDGVRAIWLSVKFRL